MAKKKYLIHWKKKPYYVGHKRWRSLLKKKILTLSKQPNTSNIDISKVTKVSTKTISTIQKELANEGLLQLDEKGRIDKPKKSVDEQLLEHFEGEPFIKHKAIKRLIEVMKESEQNPTPIVSKILVVCRTIEKSPRMIMEYKDDESNIQDPFKGLTKAMMEFREHMNNNTIKYISPKNAETWGEGEDKEITDYVKAMRKLYSSNGMPVPKNYGGKNHMLTITDKTSGAYSDIQLTDKQYEDGSEFIRTKHNKLFETMYRFIDETAARTNEGFEWVNNLVIKKELFSDGHAYEYGVIKQFFSEKTNDYWTKVVLDPKTLSLLKEIPKGEKIYPQQTRKYKNEFVKIMRETLVYLGLLPKSILLPRKHPERPKFKKGTELYKMEKDPANILRHDGAHRTIRRNNMNPSKLIARGWESSGKTAIKFYAKPQSDLMQENICHYCKPPKGFDPINPPDNLYFCCEAHYIIYSNNGNKPIENIIDNSELLRKYNEAQEQLKQLKNQIEHKPDPIADTMIEKELTQTVPQIHLSSIGNKLNEPEPPKLIHTELPQLPQLTEDFFKTNKEPNGYSQYDQMDYTQLLNELSKIDSQKETEKYNYLYDKITKLHAELVKQSESLKTI